MARSILVLILAAVPALAQYNANTYNVRPSGGSVGQVCFYETAANGSNKFCITGESSLSGDTSTSVASLLSWTRSGTNTYLTNAGDSVGINTSTPIYQFTVESATYTAGERFLFGARAADGSVSVVAGYRADGATGTAGIFRAGGNKPLDLGTTGTPQAIRIEDGGNVGIGTTSPGALLHVDGLMKSTGLDAAPSGGTGNEIKTRVLSVYQDTSTTVHWFFETPSSNTFRLKANDAKPALTFDTSVSPGNMILADNTATSGIAYHFIPGSTSGVQDLGASSTPWRTAYLKTSLIHSGTTRIDSSGNGNFASLQIGGGTIINSSSKWGADLMPSIDNTHALGGPSLRWNSAHIENLTVASCTGCGSGALPVVDTTSIVEGSADGTKELRIEVDGITTGTVRVWTAPNANITVAGVDLAQTWTATQVMQHLYPSTTGTYDLGDNSTPRRWRNIDFTGVLRQSGSTLIDGSGGANFTSLSVASTTRIDNSGVGNLASLQIGGTEVLTSTRYWTGSLNFEPSTDNNVTLGTTSRRWYGITASNNLSVYDGTYYRVSANTGGLFLRNSSGTTKVSLDSSSGQITGDSYYVGANLLSNSSRDLTVNSVTWPSSFAVVNSSGNATFLATTVSSLSISSGGSISLNGTTRLDSSGNFRANNMRVDSQLHLAYTDDNSWAIGDGGTNTTAKIAIYDTSGSFIGWVPVFP